MGLPAEGRVRDNFDGFQYIASYDNLLQAGFRDEAFAELCERVGKPDGPELIKSEAVTAQLQRNSAAAIDLGVYGVPTFRLNDQLFWGEDALPMVLYCARTPNWLESREVKRISSLPWGLADKPA